MINTENGIRKIKDKDETRKTRTFKGKEGKWL